MSPFNSRGVYTQYQQ